MKGVERRSALFWLESWFNSQCDGDWEHGYGISIKTLDNPGWSVEIDVKNVPDSLTRVEIERSENDWVYYWVEDGKFSARGGPRNLDEMLTLFRQWIEGVNKS